MELPPLTLEVVRLTPVTVIPGLAPPSPHLTSPRHSFTSQRQVSPSPSPVPHTAAEPPAPGNVLSNTSNYPGPYGLASLGETLRVAVNLRNTSNTGVRGPKMMVEVQSPSGRFRLGEAMHGDKREEGADPSQLESRLYDDLPLLEPLDGVPLEGSHAITELGTHILICSVAWETREGRRTFQRFIKFNVNAPLAIKTRVHTPSNPNNVLSKHRSDVYLEVLVQNVSAAALAFERVVLDPVPGLMARSIGKEDATAAGVVPEGDAPDTPSLLPGDTTQRLFLLSPTEEAEPSDEALAALPLSSFPPTFATGTVLPLGRLDLSWVSGPYREHGRFQTSTLNRRTPIIPILSPGPASRPGTPQRMSIQSARNSLIRPSWELDLVVEATRTVPVEEEFTLNLKVSIRSSPVLSDDASPPPPGKLRLGVQILSPAAPPPPQPPLPALTIRPPSRMATPMTPARPASPAPSLMRSPSLSRPMTPVSQQLRHAAVSNLASPVSTPPSIATPPPVSAVPSNVAFPPPPIGAPVIRRGVAAPPAGRVVALGSSLVLPPPADWRLTRERAGTTYAAEVPGTTIHRRWEANYEVPVRFLGLAGGLADLGGARVLLMNEGTVGREWDSLGDVWVSDE